MLLEEYENLHFIKKDGSYDVTPCPKRNTDPFLREGFLFSSNEIWKKEGCKVYPPEYFSPIDYETKKIKITENTYSIHHYMASWIPKEEKELAKELSDIKARYNKIYAMVLMQRKKYKFDKNKGNCKNLFGYIIMKIKKKSFMKNSIYNMLYEIVNLLFPFVTSQYLSRILLPEGVGKVASVQNMVSYFVTIAALGIPSYGVREFAKVRENNYARNQLFTELFLLNIISTTFAIAGFFGFVIVNGGVQGEWALYCACGVTVFFHYLNIDWLYYGLEEYAYITVRSLITKSFSLLGLLLFVKTKQDYVIYAWVSSLTTGANYIINVIRARKFVKLDFSNLRIQKHMKPVFLIAGTVFFSSVYNKLDITMLYRMATDTVVGFYSYAQKIIAMVLAMANAVTATFLPRLCNCYEHEKEEFYQLLDKGFQILCMITFPMSAGLFLVADQAVGFFYGKAFSPAGLTIRLMCPLILIKSFGNLFCYQIAYSTKNENIILPASALASVINIIMNAIFIPAFLQNGAAVASVFSELVTNVMQFIYIKKKVRMHLDKRALLIGVVSTGIMSVCVFLIMQIRLPNTIGFFVEMLCGVVVYIWGNLKMKNQLMDEWMKEVKRLLSL